MLMDKVNTIFEYILRYSDHKNNVCVLCFNGHWLEDGAIFEAFSIYDLSCYPGFRPPDLKGRLLLPSLGVLCISSHTLSTITKNPLL